MRPYSAYPNQLFDFLQTGTNFTNTLGLSGGGAERKFQGIFRNYQMLRVLYQAMNIREAIFNVGINHTITKKLKLQLNVNYADEDYINPPQIGTQGDGAVNFFNRMPISTTT